MAVFISSYFIVYIIFLPIIYGEISLSSEPIADLNSTNILAKKQITSVENIINATSKRTNHENETYHGIEKKNITSPIQSNSTNQSNGTVDMEKDQHPVVRAYFSDGRKQEKNHKKTMIPIGQLLDDGKILTNQEEDIFSESRDIFPRRFELYPKWYSNKIPFLFGKSFARRYFHPYERQISQRTRIERGEKGARRTYPHELPSSWLAQQQEQQKQVNELPQEFVEMTPGKISPIQRNHPAMNLANAVGEIVDIPDQQRLNTDNIQPSNQLQQQYAQQEQGVPQVLRQEQPSEQEEEDIEEGEGGNEMATPYVKEIPHELMDRLNPVEYAPDAGSSDEHWEEYATLPHNHHHRHKHNPCFHTPCLNSGSCHFQQRLKTYKFKCSCKNGYAGHYCEHMRYSCHPNPCLHGGTCTKTKSAYFCTCSSDYKGHDCEAESACLHNPCINAGICTETATGFYCQCGKGYTGKTCDEKQLPCTTNPCKNGATCRDLEEEERFECICPPGFGCIDCSCPVAMAAGEHGEQTMLVSSTPSPMSAATCPPNACRNGGSCFKGTMGFSCNCPTGYHGVDCSMPDLCNPNPCENNGVCVQDGEENYKCICPYGFKGADCQTPLACSSHPCMNGASCLETPDGFHCKCVLGYKGRKCTDLSPCSRNPCTHKATCVEKGALFTCACRSGYRGNTCREKDPCVPNPCSNGICGEINGIVSCNCTHGWMGESCDIENLCQENRCLNGATCVHTLEEFKCVCKDGYHGLNCEHHSPCLSRPCMNGGVCEAAGSTFICRCEQGYHGERCHLRSNCHPNPCRNGGKCYEGDETYICECPHPFTGKFCDEQHLCLSQPCMNDGRCIETTTSYQCKCLLGNYGRYCEMTVCEHNPCHNGGTCTPTTSTENSFACECVFPYHGSSCEEVDPCLPNPCKNGGTCHSHLQRIHDSANGRIHDDNLLPSPFTHDENVISVVGPIMNDTFRHHAFERGQEVSYMPDATVTTHEVHHFHVNRNDEDRPNSHMTYYDHENYLAHHGQVQDPHLKMTHFVSSEDAIDESPHIHARIRDLTGSKKSILRTNEISKIKIIRDDIAAKKTSGKYQQNEMYKFKQPIESNNDDLTRRSNGARKRDQIITKRLRRNVKVKEKIHEYRRRFSASGDKKVPSIIVNIRNAESSEIVKRTLHDLYVCQCSSGYLGAHCQHANPCERNPCWNGGTCIPHGDKFQCNCKNGYGGLKCDDSHPCIPNPCNHGGSCRLERSVHGYICDCRPGYMGYNCEEQNLCMFTTPCQNGGKCVTIEDQMECRCRARFSGRFCEVDKCSHCDENAFCHHGHCVCKPLFIGNGFKCKALGDPCIPNPCDNHGVCKEGQDGKIFTCDCRLGYVGSRCEYPNPCASSPCLHNSACIDESNSKEKGILLVDRHDYKCFCSIGYKGNDCEESILTACASSPCVNNGTCFDSSSESHRQHLSHIDDYECYCQPGFTGKNCEIHHYPCYSSPCLNHGSCLDSMQIPEASFDAHGYKCNCHADFTGRNCEVTLQGPGPCHVKPCSNNGRCVDMRNNKDPDIHFDYDHEFKCFCDPQYSGRLCEVPYPACYSMPCLHNGTCLDRTKDEKTLIDDSGFKCTCQPGYEGKNCERQYSFANSDDGQLLHGTTDPFDLSPPATPLVVYVKPTHTMRHTTKHPTLTYYFTHSLLENNEHAQPHLQVNKKRYSKMSQNQRLASIYESAYASHQHLASNLPQIHNHTFFTMDDSAYRKSLETSKPNQNPVNLNAMKLKNINNNINRNVLRNSFSNAFHHRINQISIEQTKYESAVVKHVIPQKNRGIHKTEIVKYNISQKKHGKKTYNRHKKRFTAKHNKIKT